MGPNLNCATVGAPGSRAFEREGQAKQPIHDGLWATEKHCRIDLVCVGSQFQCNMITCVLRYSDRELKLLQNIMITLYYSLTVGILYIFSDLSW